MGKRNRGAIHLTGSNQNVDQYCGSCREYERKFKCQECEKLKDIKKTCLRCEKQFTPGCGAKHVCKNCLYNKRES